MTRHDGLTSSRLVDDDRRLLVSNTTQQVGQVTRRRAVKSSVNDDASLNWIRSGARSQWKLTSRGDTCHNAPQLVTDGILLSAVSRCNFGE